MECLNCQEETLNPKFCCQSFFATYSNKGKRRHGQAPNSCLICKSKTSSHLNKYCSRKCYLIGSEKNKILSIENGLVYDPKTVKKYLIKRNGNICNSCNISTWQNQSLTLELDHIDGNPDNNYPDNLQLLCPNCHSLTPTHRFKGGRTRPKKMDSRNIKRRSRYKMVLKQEVES